MSRLALLPVVLALSGCGFKVGLINDPPATDGYANPSSVTVYRAKSPVGWLVPMTFLIEGVEIYGLWPDESFSFQLVPGEYIFGYYLGLTDCRRYGQIRPNESYRIRLAPNCVIEREKTSGRSDIIDSYTINLVNDEFQFDQATLTPAMQSALDELAWRVKQSPGEEQLTIVGHTDSVGSPDYNDRLGMRRAAATKGYLVSAGGLRSSRIRTASRGERDPVATNTTEEGRSRNRRIEVRAELYQGP